MVRTTEAEKPHFHADPVIEEVTLQLFLEASAIADRKLEKLHTWEQAFKRTASPEVVFYVEAMVECLAEDYAGLPQRVTAAFLKRIQDLDSPR